MMNDTPYELLKDDEKKQLGKNNKANMTLYNALPLIEEAKDLDTLPLDELINNLKVCEMILENDDVVSNTTTKEKVKSLALKAKVTREQTSDDSDSQGGSDKDVDEEEAEVFNLMARNFRLGIKEAKSLDKGEVVTIMEKKATSLVSVQSPRRTSLLSKELGVSKPSSYNYDIDIIDMQKKNEELLRLWIVVAQAHDQE
nr:hypothetical protein [Tanacetum cinerariifolium]